MSDLMIQCLILHFDTIFFFSAIFMLFYFLYSKTSKNVDIIIQPVQYYENIQPA